MPGLGLRVAIGGRSAATRLKWCVNEAVGCVKALRNAPSHDMVRCASLHAPYGLDRTVLGEARYYGRDRTVLGEARYYGPDRTVLGEAR